MAKSKGSERALVPNAGEDNTDTEKAKALLLVLNRGHGADVVEMLGLTNFLRARRGEAVVAEQCPVCATPMDAANTKRTSDGRILCRCCHRRYRRELFASKRAAA